MKNEVVKASISYSLICVFSRIKLIYKKDMVLTPLFFSQVFDYVKSYFNIINVNTPFLRNVNEFKETVVYDIVYSGIGTLRNTNIVTISSDESVLEKAIEDYSALAVYRDELFKVLLDFIGKQVLRLSDDEIKEGLKIETKQDEVKEKEVVVDRVINKKDGIEVNSISIEPKENLNIEDFQVKKLTKTKEPVRKVIYESSEGKAFIKLN